MVTLAAHFPQITPWNVMDLPLDMWRHFRLAAIGIESTKGA